MHDECASVSRVLYLVLALPLTYTKPARYFCLVSYLISDQNTFPTSGFSLLVALVPQVRMVTSPPHGPNLSYPIVLFSQQIFFIPLLLSTLLTTLTSWPISSVKLSNPPFPSRHLLRVTHVKRRHPWVLLPTMVATELSLWSEARFAELAWSEHL
ncbi:hypothetical protein LZ31DRAFT_359175 [Colletotrichum somersetense]|nr:hypothetical protein LZ31DRAFT_359175 [Colletotrichum somersetense]